MGNMILMVLLLALLPTETQRSTTLFASVIIRCDYSTSANPQDVLVTWRYKSFCKDPVLDYYSTAFQAAKQLGQDPTNDCPDSQRTLRTVIQKRGINQPTLGSEYSERKITIQNKADLVISEVMWWDNGVYFCTIDAPGDTTGDSDREVKLIVYLLPAEVLLLRPLPVLSTDMLLPRERMIREAQKAMAPWMNGQPIYAPIGSNASSQGVPMLYSGSFLDYPTKQNYAMAPMQLSPMALQHQPSPPPPPPPPPHHMNGSGHGNNRGTGQVLDYLENQVRGLDVGAHQMAPYAHQNMLPLQPQLQPQPAPQAVPNTPGPPSMLSALDEMGVRGLERRVITLPPIIQRVPSFSSRREPGGGDRARSGPRISSQSSGSTNRSGGGHYRGSHGYRDATPPRRGILREYSDDSKWENRRARAPHRSSRNERVGSAGSRGGGSRPRTRSRDDLMEELHSRASRREKSYSPPQRRKGSWSSDEEEDSRRRKDGKGKDWPEKPPSYFSIETQPGRSRGNYEHLSDRSSRSGTSVVI
ncbi:hypothetical protein FQN60_001200 [Etheostoma spectabile]|uniref:Ig-like domain-containing protein n=1 Tax=Etheostoma spectabile TaxID=54343 RepID=A0A5J5D5U7_9PERO|nr:hypothetical protein FQN60_001200 [Etheostoma spectabile]